MLAHKIDSVLPPLEQAFPIRHDWTKEEIAALFALPMPELMFKAQLAHRTYFDPTQIQVATLLSIKSGGCPEDCAYCPQSAKHAEKIKADRLMAVDEVLKRAKAAKEEGATRFCMGAAWRSPKDHDLETVCAMIEGVKNLGLETCVTLGMLNLEQTLKLKQAGLDYYNHNLDTSEEHYEKIISTRTYQDRLDTLAFVRDAGIKVCCGGILGMNEQEIDRANMIKTLANLPKHPESVPINLLIRVKGTPLEDAQPIDPMDFIRTIAVTRITMPQSYVRLAAGRTEMSAEMQTLCYLAGVNSIFLGERLLTCPNPEKSSDLTLFNKLGLKIASKTVEASA
ncbi:biotin synthase BioB [Commensalibacter oyaizuii]|uniref:Biotin synthase n=1 Tax=Commensalibacter oyaizuii TaxID=3043873 RepID=A0ABT6Q1P0_9PROT|nr:biotin synthase BioB [Commensalibacter sp. TBRC 16381]MDI2091025.1 biotin synthase BioB [Commensalibacter sp. TBRC 16381]